MKLLRSYPVLPLFILLSGSLCISCKKGLIPSLRSNHPTFKVLGHAGMGTESIYPMNSQRSISKCLQLGADGTEFDVQLTSDSVLVAFHDEELSNKTSLKGNINSHTWEEISRGYYTYGPYKDFSIVKVEELLRSTPNIQSLHFTFDCKLYSNKIDAAFYLRFAEAIDNLLVKYEIAERCCIESTDPDFISIMRTKNNSCKLFIYAYDLDSGIEMAKRSNANGITIMNAMITKEQVEMLHENKLEVAIWDLHSREENKDAIAKEPDYIQTDAMKSLLYLIK
jgi:glycerophosphoryl diester phosphodiesterase